MKQVFRNEAGELRAPEERIAQPTLKRAITLPLAVLYGLGTTIGAGIYVLIGATAARAGTYAPFAFLVAALVMAPTTASFAELAGRRPVSAGPAAYVRTGFGSDMLALITGLMVIASGIISSAAVATGAAGYVRVFADLPDWLIVLAILLALGGVAAWGILESVALAGLFTLIEVGGLAIIIASGFLKEPGLLMRIDAVFPPLWDAMALTQVLSAGLLAFFAFIGFEDLATVAEEVKNPERNLPRAIFLTLIITTGLYFLVVSIAVLLVPIPQLARAEAPLGLVFERIAGASPALISAIAIIATLNGIVVQIIMASRVMFGLARQGELPRVLGTVHRRTRTPLIATALVVALVATLALAFPLEGLAESTSRFALAIFALINAALLRIKLRGDPAPPRTFIVPLWVPAVGLLLSLAFLVNDLLR